MEIPTVEEFKKELTLLFEKYNLELDINVETVGYYGHNVIPEFYIPSIYNENHECLREAAWIEIWNFCTKDSIFK